MKDTKQVFVRVLKEKEEQSQGKDQILFPVVKKLQNLIRHCKTDEDVINLLESEKFLADAAKDLFGDAKTGNKTLQEMAVKEIETLEELEKAITGE